MTSTRADLYHLTAGARSQRGPVYVFNPQHVGGLPGGFSWNLLDPCADLVMARRMASWLTGAMTGADSNLGNLEWFTSAADTALMAMLHAAAIGGYTITDVYAWCQLQGHEAALPGPGKLPGERTTRRRGPAGDGNQPDGGLHPGVDEPVPGVGDYPADGRRGDPAGRERVQPRRVHCGERDPVPDRRRR